MRWCVPRYYFHLINDMDVRDEEGKDLPDPAAAHAHALEQICAIAGEMAKDEGRIVLGHRIDIEDEHCAVLESVWFRDALQIED